MQQSAGVVVRAAKNANVAKNHKIQLVKFDEASLRVIWLCCGSMAACRALLALTGNQHEV
jgi:hypothetical protein